MSEDRLKFKNYQDALLCYQKPSNAICHLLRNDDDTYSIMYHIVCEHCDYCGQMSFVYESGLYFDELHPLIHKYKDDPYENQKKLEMIGDEE